VSRAAGCAGGCVAGALRRGLAAGPGGFSGWPPLQSVAVSRRPDAATPALPRSCQQLRAVTPKVPVDLARRVRCRAGSTTHTLPAEYLRVGSQPVGAWQALRSSSSVSRRSSTGCGYRCCRCRCRALSRLELVFPLLSDRLRPDNARPRRVQLRLDHVNEACIPSKTMARPLRNSSFEFRRCAWRAVAASSGYSSRGRLAITAVPAPESCPKCSNWIEPIR
jgi:hypothetical protein